MTKKLYSVDVAIYATAYIKAESFEEARRKIEDDFMPNGLELSGGPVCGMSYDALMANDDPTLEITLSPAMTPDRLTTLDFRVAWEPEGKSRDERS